MAVENIVPAFFPHFFSKLGGGSNIGTVLCKRPRIPPFQRYGISLGFDIDGGISRFRRLFC